MVVGFAGLAAAFVIVATLMPSSASRRVGAQRRKLQALTRATGTPTFVQGLEVDWQWGYAASGQRAPRRVVVHDFVRFGVPLPKGGPELWQEFFATGRAGQGGGGTATHFAFDPNDPLAMRLALAYRLGARRRDFAVKSAMTSDLRAGVGVEDALRRRAVREALLVDAGSLAAIALQEVEKRELAQDAIDSAAVASGTRLFECGGRIYRRRDPRGASPTDEEIVSALSDAEVPLP